jgi:hypothetical protein
VIYVKFHKIAFVLLLIGGLNWLLVGLFQKDLFVFLGMDMGGWIARTVYILVGLAAVSELLAHKRLCKMCEKKMGQM